MQNSYNHIHILRAAVEQTNRLAVVSVSTKAVGISLPVTDGSDPNSLLAMANFAEEVGLNAVFLGEVAGPEVFSMLGALANATRHITLGTGVVPIFTRPPALTAVAFATVAAIAGNRVVAGIGTGSPTITRDWMNLPHPAGLRAMTEYVEVLRQVLGGQEVMYDGDVNRVRGFRLGISGRPDLPVLIGAMGARMSDLSGAIADGLITSLATPVVAGTSIGRARAIHEERGCPTRFVGATSFIACVDDDGSGRQHVARMLANYATVRSHRTALKHAVPHVDFERVASARVAEDWERAIAALDDAPEALAVFGDEASLRDRVEQFHSNGADLVLVCPITTRAKPVSSAMRTIESLGRIVAQPGSFESAREDCS